MGHTKGGLVRKVLIILKEYGGHSQGLSDEVCAEIEERIPLVAAAPDLLAACEAFLSGWSHFCGCIDFGKSNLDAETIRFMNEVPGKIQQAGIKAEGK